jgi:hypothetical protein
MVIIKEEKDNGYKGWRDVKPVMIAHLRILHF